MNKKIYLSLAILFLTGYFLLTYNVHGNGYSEQFNAMLGVATFLFGIFLAFSIYNNQNKLSHIKELLRTDDSHLITMYKLSSVFGKDVQKDVQNLIDEYLIPQIDFKLVDFDHSYEAFEDLYDYITQLEPKNDKQVVTYQNLLTTIDASSQNRKLVETMVQQGMSNLEWVSITILLFLIMFFGAVFNPGGLMSSLITTAVPLAGIILIIVLRQLDTLTWQEESWIWEPLRQLFSVLDLIPYYPRGVIVEGRAKVPAGTKARVAYYYEPYPDMSGKKIKILEIGKDEL